MEIHLDPGALHEQLAHDVRAGLTGTPKTLPPKYFYDARGSELFDEITRLPEYYPTRAERAILIAHADEIAAATRAQTLVELGSGTSEKTRLLLRALRGAGTLRRFVPFDVDPAVLKDASTSVAAEFPGVEVEPVVGDFEQHLGLLPAAPHARSPSSAPPSATSIPTSDADSCARSAASCDPVRDSCSASIS